MASQLSQRVMQNQSKQTPAFIDTNAYPTEMVQREQMPSISDEPVAPAREEPQVPEKTRTSPRVAEMRRHMRPKLLSTPSKADKWDREDPEAQRTILERMKSFLQSKEIG